MKKYILSWSIFMASCFASASDVGFGLTRSSSSQSQKVKASYSFDRQYKISLSSKKSLSSTAGLADPDSSSLRATFRYKNDAGSTYAFDLKKSDETYFYEGTGVAVREGLAVTSSTRLNIAGEFSMKKYNLKSSENLLQTAFSVGIDQEISENLSFGADYSLNNFNSVSVETAKALKGTTIATSDITSYVSALVGPSTTVFVEYAFSFMSLGASYTIDTYIVGDAKTVTTEFNTDVLMGDSWAVGGFFARSQTDNVVAASDSSGLSLTYSF